MNDSAENKVSKFYNSAGWETKDEITEDARRWEDLREYAAEYIKKTRLRVLSHIPDHGDNMLDMASGPIQYAEYLEYSRNYDKRYCVDLSSMALREAKRKIGDHGEFFCGSFFDIYFDENFFDCTISLHTIYHIERLKQEEAVRKLLHVTKPGKPVIIVYSNPNCCVKYFKFLIRLLRKIKRLDKNTKNRGAPTLYFYAHPIEWWNRFSDTAEVRIFPWRSFKSKHQKILVPDNKFGKILFAALFSMESKFPSFFAKHFQYPMIVLTKNPEQSGDNQPQANHQ